LKEKWGRIIGEKGKFMEGKIPGTGKEGNRGERWPKKNGGTCTKKASFLD